MRLEDAVDLVDMLNAKSEATVRAVWERPSAGIIERREGEKLEAINSARFQHFTWELAAVRGDPKQRNLPCICNVDCSESQCGHNGAIYEHTGEIQLLPRASVPATRESTKGRGRGVVRGRASRRGRGRGRGRGRSGATGESDDAVVDVDDGEAGPDCPRLEGASHDDGGQQPNPRQQPEIARILQVHVAPDLIQHLQRLFAFSDASKLTSGAWMIAARGDDPAGPSLSKIVMTDSSIDALACWH